MKKLMVITVLSFFVIACKKELVKEQTLIVADHKVSCTGLVPQQCLLIKEKETDNWEFFYDHIEGFDYESGYQYVIEIKVYDVTNPPIDGSGKRYVLKRIINKQ
jgi:hypothetical protein